MILIHITYKMTPENREGYIKEILDQNLIALTLAEPGCKKYVFSVPIDSDSELVLNECWEDAEALKVHAQGENIKKVIALKEKYELETVLEKYEV